MLHSTDVSSVFKAANRYNDAFLLILYEDEDIVIAQHDFNPTSDSDLPFKKGEKLKVIHE